MTLELSKVIEELITKFVLQGPTDQICAETITTRSFARLARENDDFLLLLPSSWSNKKPPIVLAHISVHFGKECRVHDGEKVADEVLSIVRIHEPNHSELEVFGDVISLLLTRLPENDDEGISDLIDQLIELFSSLSQPSIASVVGLWGELFLILQSKNPDVVAQAWHATPQDKFDMSEGSSRVEVKTTRGPRRHLFSYEQIAPHSNIQVVVASLIITEDPTGFDVLELLNLVIEKLGSAQLRTHVLKIGIGTIGVDLSHDRKIRFDLVGAGLNLRYFAAADIPKPLPPPPGVSEMKFKSDLQLVPNTPISAFAKFGDLFSALSAGH
jgi:hypothetical protein